MIWLSSGIVFVASNKSTSTSYLRTVSGLLAVSAFNAALDNHSIVSARRSRKICSTASASSAMRGWLWSSVKRFRQQASKYILTCPLCCSPQHPARSPSLAAPSTLPHRGLFTRLEIPRPMRPPDAELGLPVADPPRVIVHLPPAYAHHVPPRRRMIPVAVRHFRKRVPRPEVSDVIRRKRNLTGSRLVQKVANQVHVLSPIQIALGDEPFGMPARDLVGVREVIGMRQRARNYLPAKQREQQRRAQARPSPRRMPQQGGRRRSADYRQPRIHRQHVPHPEIDAAAHRNSQNHRAIRQRRGYLQPLAPRRPQRPANQQ